MYIILSARRGSGIPRSLLNRIFPGATIKDWKPRSALSGRAKELFEVIEAEGEVIEKRVLRKKMGISPSQLIDLIKHADVVAALDETYPGWTKDHKRLFIPRRSKESATMSANLPF